MKHSQPKTIQAIIHLKVPEHQIGQDVSIYFKDTMCIKSTCEKDQTGHWIKIVVNGQHKIKCDKCDYIEPEYITHIRNFCPNCGTPMEES